MTGAADRGRGSVALPSPDVGERDCRECGHSPGDPSLLCDDGCLLLGEAGEDLCLTCYRRGYESIIN